MQPTPQFYQKLPASLFNKFFNKCNHFRPRIIVILAFEHMGCHIHSGSMHLLRIGLAFVTQWIQLART